MNFFVKTLNQNRKSALQSITHWILNWNPLWEQSCKNCYSSSTFMWFCYACCLLTLPSNLLFSFSLFPLGFSLFVPCLLCISFYFCVLWYFIISVVGVPFTVKRWCHMWLINATYGNVETTCHMYVNHMFVNQTNVNCALKTSLTFTCMLFGTAPQLNTFEVQLQIAFHTYWAAGSQCTCNSMSRSAYHLCEVHLLIFFLQL